MYIKGVHNKVVSKNKIMYVKSNDMVNLILGSLATAGILILLLISFRFDGNIILLFEAQYVHLT